MNDGEIGEQLAAIRAEPDVLSKHLRVASLVGALFREHGYETVVVGGSGIEFYTEGRYVSGDLDLCLRDRPRPEPRVVAGIMQRLGARGGIRSFHLAGVQVDILGELQSDARTPFVTLEGPCGPITLTKPEDLLVERVFSSVYPQANDEARRVAEIMMAVALEGRMPFDWQEAERVAASPAYDVKEAFAACRRQVQTRPASPDTPASQP